MTRKPTERWDIWEFCSVSHQLNGFLCCQHMWVCWGVPVSKWHEYHQMVSSRRCVDAEYLPSFVWPYGLIGRALWLRVCMTGQLHVLMLQPLLETLKHRKKMQQCYEHQHWSAVLWYKDWCQLGQNKLQYHQISRGDVWPPSAQRSGREHGSSTAAQVSAQFQSNRLFLCVRRWNKNKWVTYTSYTPAF